MKKLTSLAIALALGMGAVSCGKKKSSSDTDKAKNTSASYTEYNAADIEMGSEFTSVCTLDRDVKSGDIFIFGQTGENDWHGYTTTKEFSDRTDFKFYPSEGETVLSAALLGFGKKGILTCKDGKTLIHIINSDGAEEKLLDCGEILVPDDNGNIYGRLFRNGDGFAVSDSSGAVHFISSDGEYLGEPQLDGMTVVGISPNKDGGVTLLYMDAANSMFMADSQGTEIVNQRSCDNLQSSALAMCTGFGDYQFAGVFIDGLYVCRDDIWTKLSDLSTLDFYPVSVSGIVMTGENEFAVVDSGASLHMISEQDISSLKSKKIVTLAVYEGRADSYQKLAKRYNDAHPDSEYKIEVQQYLVNENISYDQMMSNMKMDIITGDAPDIIVDLVDGLDPSVYYVDLNEYLKDDPDLNADDFIPGYLDAVTVKGTIPMIFPDFSVDSLMGKTRFVGEKENWTYDDFIAAYEAMPEGMKLAERFNGKMSDMLFYYVNIYEFVNYNNGTCDFESPEFIKMMEFIKDNHIGLNQQEWDDLFYGNDIIFWEEETLTLRNNKCLLGDSFTHPGSMSEKLHAVFDEEVTFVGYPSINGKGGFMNDSVTRFSIMKTSKYPDAAWDFIKSVFEDEMYDTYQHTGYPTLEEKFVERIDEAENVYHYENSDRNHENKIPGGRYYYDQTNGDIFIEYEAVSEEEKARCTEYVRSCVQNFKWYDSDLQKILAEELDEYFNSDKSAEDTAEMIQNRASIYISEVYG